MKFSSATCRRGRQSSASAGSRRLPTLTGSRGPAGCSKGEDGSPVIALKIAIEQTKPGTKVLFLFVELDVERARVLQSIVDGIQRPADIRVKIAEGKTFEEAFAEFLAFYESKRQSLPPTFAFIDPFGGRACHFRLCSG